ncbi:uncharacterized protein LOC122008312 [Zingiber officinale]|nr:uncharacterized protein LOC122008312 [Zingiber officinale]
MTLDLDLAEESSERMNLNSPSTSSLKNIDPNDLDSFAKQLESVYRWIEGQLPEPEGDAGIEDFFIYSNDVAPHAFIVSSQRLLDGQDSRSRTRKPRIDEEFEQYFSMLML